MIIREDPVAAADLLTLAHDQHVKKTQRTPGLHASDLLFCLLKPRYKKKYGDQEPQLQDMLTWIIGSGYHEILQGAAPPERIEVKKVVVLLHGDHDHEIETTLDLLWDDVLLGDVPTEMKSTRGSSKAGLQPYYVEQAYTYGLAHGRPGYLRVAVVYLNGDYAPPKPSFKVYEIETRADEYMYWEAELARRACLIEGVHAPVPERYGWECSYCPWASRGCPWPERMKGRDGDKTGIRQTGFFVEEELPDWIAHGRDGGKDPSGHP